MEARERAEAEAASAAALKELQVTAAELEGKLEGSAIARAPTCAELSRSGASLARVGARAS